MTATYDYCAQALKQNNIPCSLASATFVHLTGSVKVFDGRCAEAGLELAWKIVKGGVWSGQGQIFCSEKNRNFRLTFTTPEQEFKLGIKRLVTLSIPITNTLPIWTSLFRISISKVTLWGVTPTFASFRDRICTNFIRAPSPSPNVLFKVFLFKPANI
jgi:hypothetical protein